MNVCFDLQTRKRIWCSKNLCREEAGPEELITQKKVTDKLLGLNCSFSTFDCRNLFHADDLPFSLELLPDVFSAFRKSIENTVSIIPVLPKPLAIVSPPMATLNLAVLNELNSTDIIAAPRAFS